MMAGKVKDRAMAPVRDKAALTERKPAAPVRKAKAKKRAGAKRKG